MVENSITPFAQIVDKFSCVAGTYVLIKVVPPSKTYVNMAFILIFADALYEK